jgi:hypothetical protein
MHIKYDIIFNTFEKFAHNAIIKFLRINHFISFEFIILDFE